MDRGTKVAGALGLKEDDLHKLNYAQDAVEGADPFVNKPQIDPLVKEVRNPQNIFVANARMEHVSDAGPEVANGA